MPEIELSRDFMPAQINCSFHKDPIKTKQAMWVSALKGKKKKKNSSQSSDLAGIRTRPRFYACPSYLQVLVKPKQVILSTSNGVFGPTRQVTPKSIVRFGRNSNSSETFAFPDYLHPIKTKEATLQTKSNMVFFCTQRVIVGCDA